MRPRTWAVLIVAALGPLAACERAPADSEADDVASADDALPDPPISTESDSVLRARALGTMPATRVAEALQDVDADGTPETVELWVAADRDGRGRIMFDDGQRWLLLVRDGEHTVPLFDERVQLGHVRFWIVDPMDGGPPDIVLLRTQSAAVIVHHYRHDADQGGYVGTTPLELTGNLVYVSPDSF